MKPLEDKTFWDLESVTIDPPGQGRLGGHYFHTWCPSVRPSQKQEHALQR